MVGGGSRERGARGQLILITAVVIAFTLVGIVVILNTVLFTENVTSHGATASTNDDFSTQIALREGLAEFAHRTNENATHASPTAARDALNGTLTRYGELLGVSLTKRKPVSLALRTTGPPQVGALVVHDNASRSFTNATGGGNWTLDDSSPVRQFTMTVNESALVAASDSQYAFEVNVSESGGPFQAVAFARTGGGNVTVERMGATTGQCEVAPTDGEITVDFWTGTIAESSCAFTGAGALSAPKIRYANGGNATGTYQLLANDTAVPNGGRYAVDGSAPTLTYVVTEANVSSTYVTPELTHVARLDIVVYEPGGDGLLAGGLGESAPGGGSGAPSTTTTTTATTTTTTTATTTTATTTTTTTTAPTTTPGSNQPPSMDDVAAASDCDQWWGCSTTDVTVDWQASDPDGDADLSRVTIQVVDRRLFAADQELDSVAVTAGDLSSGTESLTVTGDADYVIVTVEDAAGETDSRTEFV